MKVRPTAIRLAAALLGASILAPAAATAQFSIPGIGGDLAVKAAAKEMAPYVAAHQPVIRDWAAIYPTVPELPGAPFRPTTNARQQRAVERTAIGQLHNSHSGNVVLALGDYVLPVRVFCTDIHRHAKAPLVYLLGPLRGARAELLTRMYANAGAAHAVAGAVQALSWSLQDGMKYEELPQPQQQTYDLLLPGQRGLIAESFLELLQDRWSTISSTIPGVPSFDSALGQMGGVGSTIQDLRSARGELLANASDFDAMRNALVPGGLQGGQDDPASTPWSVPTSGVYERLVTAGAYMSVGLLEIRVASGGRAAVPVTENIGYPPKCHECQPLTMHPLEGASPEPALGFSVGTF